MKKELLIGTALVSTLGAASVAEAVSYTMSGNHQTGITFNDPQNGDTTRSQTNDNNFSISLSETTDGGMTISSSFSIVNETTASGGTTGDMDAGFSLAFTDGSKLDVINAGNASGSHDISVPGSAGGESVTVTTSNNAPTGLDFATDATVFGIEYHTASDFVADGLSMSFSASVGNGASTTSTYADDSHIAIGATYVSDLGDTAITIGTGYSSSDGGNSGAQVTNHDGGMHIGVSAVTGDLTVAVGFADGDSLDTNDAAHDTQTDGEIMKVGVKYVSGDLTFNVGMTSSTAKDSTTIGTAGTTEDSYDKTSASVSYAVASGVTAIIGYSDVDSQNEGTNDGLGGSAWYIGANMSF